VIPRSPFKRLTLLQVEPLKFAAALVGVRAPSRQIGRLQATAPSRPASTSLPAILKGFPAAVNLSEFLLIPDFATSDFLVVNRQTRIKFVTTAISELTTMQTNETNNRQGSARTPPAASRREGEDSEAVSARQRVTQPEGRARPTRVQQLPPCPGPPPTGPLPPLPPHAGPTESSWLLPEQRRSIFRWLGQTAAPEDW
jgi:hypothetical protein